METNQQTYHKLPELPNATTVLVLGILSIVFCSFIGLVLGIIALNMAKKANQELLSVPEGTFSLSSINNLKSGKTCAIIGIVISSVGTLILLVYLIFWVFMASAIFGSIGAAAAGA